MAEAGAIGEEEQLPVEPSRPAGAHPFIQENGALARPSDGSRLAIVAEQFSDHGGTERVIDAILRRHPQAQVLSPRFADEDGRRLNGDRAEQVEAVWTARRCHHYLSPLYARRMRQVGLGKAKVVLSMSSHGWALAVAVPPGARHLVYYAGPSAALYTRSRYYLRAHPWPLRPLARAALPMLRRYYQRSLRGADRLIANSHWVAARFGREHGYRPEVIHPPVRTDFFTPAAGDRDGFLFVGRLVHHKRVGDLIDAFRSLEERLVVVGEGPLRPELERSAPANVSFSGAIDDLELRKLYRSSHALIHPSVEEFGIVMAEAHACGTPVIAPRAGGALEIAADGRTGLLLDRVEPSSIAAAVQELRGRSLDRRACRDSALRFSERAFAERFDRVLAEELTRAGR